MVFATTLVRSALLVSALAGVPVARAACSGARNLALCAEFIFPFSENSFSLQTSCGVTPTSSDMLVAQNIQIDNGVGCAAGFTSTCCTSCLACGTTGIDCDGPQTAAPPANNSTQLPPGWSVAVPCAVDNANRVIEVSSVTYLPTTTPASCATQCAAQGFTFAGVEFGDECYCGTGFLDGVSPPVANPSDCNMTCAGDPELTCGGPWRMQIYSLE